MYAIMTVTEGSGDYVWVNVENPDYDLEEYRTEFNSLEEAQKEVIESMNEVVIYLDKESTGE